MAEKVEKKLIELLLWLDMETTGLNPEQDIPLEVGIILTDMSLNEIARKNWICSVDGFDPEPHDEFVLRMHQDNNLLYEIEDADLYISYFHIDREIANWLFHKLMEYAKPGQYYSFESAANTVKFQLHPAGSSIHFDLAFAKRRFPEFMSMIHHRNFDVSSIKMMGQIITGTYDPGPKDPHRALADLDNDIAWLKKVINDSISFGFDDSTNDN